MENPHSRPLFKSIFDNSRKNNGQALLQFQLRGSTIAIITPMFQASTCGRVLGELTGFFPQIDRIFPTATSKRYLKGKGLGSNAEIYGVGLGFRVKGLGRIWCLGFRVKGKG